MLVTRSLSNDGTRNSIMILFAFITLTLFNFSQASVYEDDLDPNIFLRRPQRFSFGLGKRAAAPQLSPDQFYELITKWGLGGPHGLFKRSENIDKEDNDIGEKNYHWFSLPSKPALMFKKSRGAYSFGENQN